MNQPFINVEEKIDRFVGRRTKTPDGLKAGMQMQAAGLQLHRAFGHHWFAKGVHRFKTHEEADKWMIKMLARSGIDNLEPRPPIQDDLVALCRELNQRGAKYVVVGGFAIIAAGFPRLTSDVDLLVATDMENEGKVFSALSTLPDNAVKELRPGELEQYNVIRVGDEILVDLMRLAGGIDYAEAAKDVVIHELNGVPIPFASPRLLWRMKVQTHREKDAGDLVFLRHWFAERGQEPPPV